MMPDNSEADKETSQRVEEITLAVEESRDDSSWLITASELLAVGKYSHVVSLCREHINQQGKTETIAGRLILATALYRAGQIESAREQIDLILETQPDHLMAIKLGGDIAFSVGDEWSAIASYHRVLDLDPTGYSLACEIKKPPHERTRTITLHRSPETSTGMRPLSEKSLPLYSETLGDLYLSQGHPRLAKQVYQRLYADEPKSRLAEKLAAAEEKIRESKG